jgi:diguanylate cyclase (GGDEF)-like protein/PAS domain S-box-containing protein
MKRDVSQELLRRAIAACQEALVIADARHPDTPLVYVNPAFECLTGYRPEQALGRNCRYLHREDAAQPGLEQVRDSIVQRAHCVALLRNYRQDGSLFWNQLQIAPMLDALGEVTHFMGTMLDVTQQVERERHLLEKHRQLERAKRVLEGLALRDPLTGLYNRRHFNEQLEREWNRARRERLPLSLFMIDIDHFKRFNDAHGHLAGDERIRAVGEGLLRCFARGSDLVARYGGEEFVALAPGLQGRAARERGELLCEAVRTLTTGDAAVDLSSLTVSVGLASVIPDDRLAAEDLLDAADRALYEAKHQGRDRLVQATPLRALANAA